MMQMMRMISIIIVQYLDQNQDQKEYDIGPSSLCLKYLGSLAFGVNGRYEACKMLALVRCVSWDDTDDNDDDDKFGYDDNEGDNEDNKIFSIIFKTIILAKKKFFLKFWMKLSLH